MRTGKGFRWLAAVTGAILAGTLFFFVIIGVFGLQLAILGLLLFVFAAIAIDRSFPVESDMP